MTTPGPPKLTAHPTLLRDRERPVVPNVLTPIEKFQLHCETRALLWQSDDYDLHSAVDFLERLGRNYGIDADTAQLIMARAFSRVRDDLGGWVVP